MTIIEFFPWSLPMRICIFLVLGLALFVNGVVAENSHDPIKIGWSGPLTGNSAVLGIDSVEAVRIVFDEVNAHGGIAGRSIELLVEDDQYDTAKALSAYTSLVNRGVAIIIASTYGGVIATGNKAVKDDVIVINPLDSNNDLAVLPENTFSIATESESIGRIIAEEIASKKEFPVAVLCDNANPFMVLVSNILKEKLGHSDGFVFDGYEPSTQEFRSFITKIRAKKIRSLVLLGHDQMGQAMKEARNMGIQAQFYTLGTITSPGFQKLAGEAANGTKVAYWQAPRGDKYQALIETFILRLKRPPILEIASIPSYDVANIVIDALRYSIGNNADQPINVDQIKKYLYGIKGYQGVSGVITMDPDGAVRTIRESIYTYNNGELTIAQ